MIKIEFDMFIFKEDENYVAYCPELDISSCGEKGKWSPPKLVATELAGL
jgi:hypothetical protein